MSVLLFLLTVSQAVTSIPSPPASDGVIAGRVVDAATGQPITGVVVTMLPRPTATRAAVRSLSSGAVGSVAAEPERVLVDPSGRFAFSALPPGAYEFTATRRGYVTGELGKLRPDGGRQTLTLAERGRRTDLTIRMWRHAALTGTVIDEAGEPVVGVTVQAMRREILANALRFVLADSALTDDRGVYRIGALTPGDYVIVVPSTYNSVPASLLEAYPSLTSHNDPARIGISRVASQPQPLGSTTTQRSGDSVLHSHARSVVVADPPPSGPMLVYPTTFLPAAPRGGASDAIALQAGEGKVLPALQLRPVAASRLSGMAMSPAGPAAYAVLILTSSLTDGLASEYGFEAARTVADAEGRFIFLGVPAGTYTLRSSMNPAAPAPAPGAAAAPSPPGFWAEQSVTMPAQDATVQVMLKYSLTFAGRLVFDSVKPQPAPSVRRDVMAFTYADARQRNASTGRDMTTEPGVFAIADIPGGRYLLRTWMVPGGWTLRSLTLRGVDVIDVPIDLTENMTGAIATFTDRPSLLSGAVRTASGTPDDEASVVVFPANPDRWSESGGSPIRMRTVRTAPDGTYSVSGLPDGDYLVAAIHDSAVSSWRSLRMLEQLSRSAARVTLAGAAVTQNLSRTDVR